MTTTMGKGDMLSAIAEKTNLSKTDISKIIDAQSDIVTAALQAGQKVTIGSLGIIEPAIRKAKPGRNPSTGETIQIPEKKTAKLKLSTSLKKSLA